jgi:hypothetical protein
MDVLQIGDTSEGGHCCGSLTSSASRLPRSLFRVATRIRSSFLPANRRTDTTSREASSDPNTQHHHNANNELDLTQRSARRGFTTHHLALTIRAADHTLREPLQRRHCAPRRDIQRALAIHRAQSRHLQGPYLRFDMRRKRHHRTGACLRALAGKAREG